MIGPAVAFLLMLAAAMLPRVGERLVDWLVPPGLNFKVGAALARLAIRLAASPAARSAALDLEADIRAYEPPRSGVSPIAVAGPVLRRAAASRVSRRKQLAGSPRHHLAALGSTVGLAAFSWLMVWAVLAKLAQSIPMRTAAGHYSQAAWVYGGVTLVMVGFIEVLATARVFSFVGVRWDPSRWCRLTLATPDSWKEGSRRAIRLVGAMVICSIFLSWQRGVNRNRIVRRFQEAKSAPPGGVA